MRNTPFNRRALWSKFKYVKHLIVAGSVLSIIILGRLFIGEICVVSTDSMNPAIQPTEVLVVNKASYGGLTPRRWADIPIVNVFTWISTLRLTDELNDWGYGRIWRNKEPKNGDVAVFYSPLDEQTMLVKRIHKVFKKGIAIKIDSLSQTNIVEMAEKDGRSVVYRNNQLYIDGKKSTHYAPLQNFYDMRGDNTNNSSDSRFFGYIPESYIIGKMGTILFSWDSKAAGFNKVRWNRLLRCAQ